MSTRPTSPTPTSPRINFTSPTHSASAAARNSIISSSAKGWSPLQINKRDMSSPTKDPGPSPLSTSGPRRTSSSYKHMATNSLVSNSPFRNQSASVTKEVVHERRTSRSLGESPAKATGSSATPKSAIGLGITAKRSTSRTSSHGSAVGGTRRVSSDRGTGKVVFNSAITGERKLSAGERRSSGSKENESPDVRASKRTPVKGTSGLKNLAGREYVSKSPFLNSGMMDDGPSPKTSIPVEKDDVFSSPSPTPRRVSPSKARALPEDLEQTSPTPSPSRPSSLSALSRGPAPSPLRSDFTPGSFSRPSASATPTRSSMTPSRRLHGPRDELDPSDSPSKTKTVTFQTVADVREFERLSVEGSANSSFEESAEEDEEEQEWLDDHRNSLDDLLHESGSNRDDDDEDEESHTLRVTNPDATPEFSDQGHESTTGRFVDALLDEGLLSSQATPAFEPHSVFSTEGTPQLSTPSLGDSLHATPMLATASMDTQSSSDGYTRDRDSAGIPYGRTHHSERSAAHHARTSSKDYKPPRVSQPSLPTNAESTMLLNANAAQPSPYSTPFDSQAHQEGPIPDPFITVQTVKEVLSPERQREEDGVPLGRTSHLERMQAAKQLATQQSLGLGMPRSPAIAKGLTKATKVEEEEKRHSVPKPQELDLPEPVAHREVEEVKKGHQRYSLPFVNLTSPFFKSAPQIGNETSSDSASDNDRPLTPPPSHASREVKSESPHRIPSFEFEEISLQAVNTVLTRTAKVQRSPTKITSGSTAMKVTSSVDSSTSATTTTSQSTTSTSTESRLSGSTSQNSDFGMDRDARSQESTSTRVRQRISREMIRDTINQRIADGSISRRSQSVEGYEYYDLARSPRHASPSSSTSGRGRTPLGEAKAIPMVKAHTSDSVRRNVSGVKDTRPRSQTQTAHEVLKAAERDGLILDPKSALDKLILHSPGTDSASTGSTALLSPTRTTPSKRSTLPALALSGGRDKPLPSPIGAIDEMPSTPTRRALGTPARDRKSDTPTGEGMAAREAAIIAKRREKVGDNPADWSAAIESRSGRRRRSVSTGDVGAEHDSVQSFRKSLANPRLTLGIDEDGVSILQSFREEAANIGEERAYKVREKPIVHASFGDRVSHSGAGDLATGKAWRSIRRPSDMNEHAAEIKALRAREAKAGTASGTIFVKVLGIEGLSVPIPEQQTFFCITLDNGIDYIRTPYAPLVPNAKVNQEFSLVEHPNFEFSLSIDIRRDPHILKAIHEKLNPPAPPPIPVSPVKNSGLKSLFASPRKPRAKDTKDTSRSATPLPQPSAVENMVKFFPTPNSSTIAKTHVAFKPIAKNCEAKILEIRYPMFAMFKGDGVFNGDPVDLTSSTSSTSAARKQLAKITLQMFRLPPLPGLKLEDMPQCIEDCLRGMRHHAWHGVEYQEGVLTQHGGDCTHPRRRHFKLVGGHLIAINEVTKKHVTSIDLRQAVDVLDVNEEKTGESPKSRLTVRPRGSDEGLSVRPLSFRVDFADGEEILFGCDSDEDKSVWMDTLSGLIGKIPSNPLWAELLSTRQKEKPRRLQSTATLGTKANLAVPGSVGMTQQRSANSATTSASGNTANTRATESSGYTPSALSGLSDHSAQTAQTGQSGHTGQSYGVVSSGESAVTATSSSSVQAREYREVEIRRSAPPAPRPPSNQYPKARQGHGASHGQAIHGGAGAQSRAGAEVEAQGPGGNHRHSAPTTRRDSSQRPASAQARPASAQPPPSQNGGQGGQAIRPDGRRVSFQPKSAVPVPVKR